ncbi:heme ABC transporter ATP-binding protein [Sulfitobacter sp. CW3]|uniref:heme ABC transporter ATP-binding protein n=1 Tax=Sulfitobacter sp. CW3 TaxID=2861965 RepID=UPI001C5CF2E7|nr:heme ABC transporter ATP-binding protein [Sulfitobacter sp. CW3]MBW4964184.1 heme ABC transporter ATP-binding protein [Sulfitobacter sp. CW3]
MMLEADITKAWIGHKTILQDVSFRAVAGQLTAIVGPNGAGKSSLLKAITNEIDFAGQVRFNGEDAGLARPWDLAAIRGVLPQSTTLAFPFTVIEVVRMGLLSGHSGQRDHLPDTALARVGLERYSHRLYQELSGGEQQRVQLARVLCQVWDPVDQADTPHWLLLDEPVASLDIGHQLMVMRLLKDYAARGGGVVAVMHDLNLSAMFADHMVMVVQGSILSAGTPQEVMTDDVLSQAYGRTLRVNLAPLDNRSFILPHVAAV